MTYRFTANGSYAATGKAVGSIVGVLSVFEWSIFDTEHSNACYCLLQGIPRCFTLFRTFLQGLRPGISLFRSWPRGAPANGFKIRVGFFVKIPNSHSHFSNSWNSTPFFFFSRNDAVSIQGYCIPCHQNYDPWHVCKGYVQTKEWHTMCCGPSRLSPFPGPSCSWTPTGSTTCAITFSEDNNYIQKDMFWAGRKLSARSNGQWLMNLCSWWMLMNADWCWWMQWIQWKLMTSCVETLKSRHVLLQGSISVGLFDFWAHTDGLWLLEGPVWLPNIWKVHSEDRMIQNHSITA